jgi:hypothetical protein
VLVTVTNAAPPAPQNPAPSTPEPSTPAPTGGNETTKPTTPAKPTQADDDKGEVTPEVTDTSAPVLTAMRVAGIGTDTATINWESSEPASSSVTYYKQGAKEITITRPALIQKHAIVLTGLDANSTYSFVVTSVDAAGNKTTGETFDFTTLRVPPSATDTSGNQPEKSSRAWLVPSLIGISALIIGIVGWRIFVARRSDI